MMAPVARSAGIASRQAPPLAHMSLLLPSVRPQPLPLRYVRTSPCQEACPAGIAVKSYVSLIAEERFAEALEVIRRRCPLPAVCGRVCPSPCEAACRRGDTDEPVAIRALKRFVADRELDLPPAVPDTGPEKASRVAVIGAGPAGLTAAYDLRLAGFPVTVFDAASEPGGMLRYGIAEYRLPRNVLSVEIESIVRAGVHIETGRRLGGDLELEKLLADGYHAVLLATGASIGRRLGIPGDAEHAEIEDALGFLRRVNDGDRSPVGRRVVVVGGGSTAVEAARAARRLGAESVQIVYRRAREQLLAGEEEIQAATREGIQFRFLAVPKRALTEQGRFTGLECLEIGLGEADESGRRRPRLIPGTEFRLPADRVLAAVGQRVDVGYLPSRGRTRLVERGHLVVDETTAMTGLAGVFAAGDLVSGPATVIDAIATGHRAAAAIQRFLDGGPAAAAESGAPWVGEYEVPDEPPHRQPRRHPAVTEPRLGDEFGEVEQVLTHQDAVAEARRCLRCGPCAECRLCVPGCHRRHVLVSAAGGDGAVDAALVRVPAALSSALPPGSPTRGWLVPADGDVTGAPPDAVSDGIAVAVSPVRNRIDDDRCRGCGSCVDVCPFAAITLPARPGDLLARLHSARCRGCNLCAAVCPTSAVIPSPVPGWWTNRLAELPALSAAAPRGLYVVLACQKRGHDLGASWESQGMHVEMLRLRCMGELQPGTLLELLRRGARRVLVSGCRSDRCRFGAGAALARDQVQRARTLLRLMGDDPRRLVTNWSPQRADDHLVSPVARLLELDRRAAATR